MDFLKVSDSCQVPMKINENSLLIRISWLNNMIRVFPMWVTESRSICCNILGLILTIGIICVEIVDIVISSINVKDTDILYTIMLDFGFLMTFCSRVIMFYYFTCKFDSNLCFKDTQINEISAEIVKNMNRRLKLFVILGILCWIYIDGYQLIISFNIWDCFITVIVLFGWTFPLYAAQCYMSIFLTQYQLYLIELTIKMKKSIDTHNVLQQYRHLNELLKQHYYIWEWFFLFRMLGLLCGEWVMVSQFINVHSNWQNICLFVVTFCIYPLPILEFIFAASKVTKMFEDFMISLWSFGYDTETFNKLNTKEYLYLLQFCMHHQLSIKLMGWKVSYKNGLKFVVAFSIAKLISYSIYYFS